ncbi:MAG: hypothetical protein R3B40_11270 [Polyangiales bacterium]|nr:hypothetical protein [Myxococcales bacterium]MCB9657170.1 hypothetical protein [Sandaracinaceae bacterium]
MLPGAPFAHAARDLRNTQLALPSVLITPLLVLFVLLGSATPRARAHGRPLGVNQFFRVDGRNVLFTTRGPVVEAADGGYRWTCSRPYGDTGQALIPNLSRTHAGALLVGTIAGLYRRAPGACAWERASGALQFVFVGDVYALPVAGARVFAVTADPVPDNVVAYSDDDGASFETVSVGDVRLQSVRVAPEAPSRVVAAGFVTGETPLSTPDGVLLVSSDAGESFDPIDVPLTDGELTLVVTHVSRSDPDLVWLRTVTTRQSDSPPERLLVVDVATQEVTDVLARPAINGAADTLDASGDAWVVTAPVDEVGGLLRVGLEGEIDVVSPALHATCVLEADTALFVCPLPRTGQSSVLERSEDGGQTFTSVLAFEDIVMTDGCADSDPEHVGTCAADLGDIERDAQLLIIEPPQPPATGGCAVARCPRWALSHGLAVMLALLLARRRRARRGRAA